MCLFEGEGELLISPLSHLEVVGNPRVETLDVDGTQKPVVVISIKVNINQKSKVLEEILGLRKLTVVNAAANLRKEIRFDLRLVPGAPCDLTRFDESVKKLIEHQPEWFNSDTNFKDAVSSIIKFKEESITQNVTDLGIVPKVRIIQILTQKMETVKYAVACSQLRISCYHIFHENFNSAMSFD